LKQAISRTDYLHYGWHNTLHIRAGLFALTRDKPASGSGLRRDPDTKIDADVILDRIETHPRMDGFVNTLPTGVS